MILARIDHWIFCTNLVSNGFEQENFEPLLKSVWKTMPVTSSAVGLRGKPWISTN